MAVAGTGVGGPGASWWVCVKVSLASVWVVVWGGLLGDMFRGIVCGVWGIWRCWEGGGRREDVWLCDGNIILG